MLTISVLLLGFLGIGLFARDFGWRTRLLMIGLIIAAIILLLRGG